MTMRADDQLMVGMNHDEREVIDQLATTGTYVTRDGDGVLRHWNGITDEYVGEEPDQAEHDVMSKCPATYLAHGPQCQLVPNHPQSLHFAAMDMDGEEIYFSWPWLSKTLT
jgi:hypothetical protein